jgi:hypothetical protein
MMSSIHRHRWGLLGFSAWLLVILSVYVMPVEWLRTYWVVWSGAVVFICVFFGGGYLLLSRPSRNAKGERQWESLWFWVLVFVGLFFLVFLRTFVFGLLIPGPASMTQTQVESYRFGVMISSAAFFVILWPTVVWVRLQVETRRALRDDAADYRNGWPPKA